jgi:hypothetical protein
VVGVVFFYSYQLFESFILFSSSFCKLWVVSGSSILFSQLWAVWGVFFSMSNLGVLGFNLVNVPSFQFFFLKFKSFQLFSSHFGGLHFIFP